MVLKRNQKTAEFDTPGSPQTDRRSLSICVECSEHESLKRFVTNHGAVGYRCGICHRADLIASRPESYKSLSYLIRALVRFYYDEWAYNGHWGGDHEPAELLSHPNPIVEHKSAPGFPRAAEDSEEFRVCLFDPPYPPYDKGIPIYAGHHEKYGRLAPLRPCRKLKPRRTVGFTNGFGEVFRRMAAGRPRLSPYASSLAPLLPCRGHLP